MIQGQAKHTTKARKNPVTAPVLGSPYIQLPTATPAPAANSAAQGAQTSTQTSASVNLTADQKTKIRTTVIQSSSAPKVSKSQINFNISVGTAVPRSVHFVAVPQTLIEIHPAWRGYSYFIVDDEIIIVDSRTLQIVAILAV